MRLHAEIRLYLPTEGIARSPTLWDRAKQVFGAKVDLSTDKARLLLEATTLVDQSRLAMKRLGVTNAVSLVIDDTVIFSDAEGRPDDIGDLMLAMSEHAPIFGAGFRTMRFATEHEEAGLRYVIEVHCLAEHPKETPAARVYVSGRIQELEAQPGESGEAYQARVGPRIANPTLFDASRRQFEAFAARLADALRTAFPEGRAEEAAAQAKVVRPSVETPEQAARRAQPGHPGYDPYDYYYPSRFEPMLSGLMIGMFMTSAFHPPFISVVHPSGAPIAPADQLDAHASELDPGSPDPGVDTPNDSGGEDPGGADGDYGGGDDGGGDYGGGDDFGGGDFGGGDFGGGDF